METEFRMVKGTARKPPEGYRKAKPLEILPMGYIWFDGEDSTWNHGRAYVGEPFGTDGMRGYTYAVPVPKSPRKAPKLQETSLKAHASQKDKAPSDCATILARIRKYRTGTTCDKLEQVLGMSHQTTSARINDLVRKGRIRDSGHREKTRTGRLAICWKVVAYGDHFRKIHEYPPQLH